MSSSESALLPYKKLLVFLTVVGLCVSVVALYEYVVFTRGLAQGPSFCNVSAHINCEVVNSSAWSSFFGVPVASYGIFFYLVLLGLLLVSGEGRSVAATCARPVILLFTAVASGVSLILFGISELVIGALCLLCLCTYIINFALLGVVLWSRGIRGSVWGDLIAGMRAVIGFVQGVLVGRTPAALPYILAILLAAAVSVASPAIAYRVAKAVSGPKADANELHEDALTRWKSAPVDSIVVRGDAGAFGDYAKGDPVAPVQIVEFADLECPGCRMLHAELKAALVEFEGRYRLVFKNYPLDAACNPGITRPFHALACFAALFTRCAGEQGRFWDALNLAFTSQHLEDVVDAASAKDALVAEGVDHLGLDSDALKECIGTERYRDAIMSDIREGDRVGLQSTPSFWINGKKVLSPSPEAIVTIIRDILKDRSVEATQHSGTP